MSSFSSHPVSTARPINLVIGSGPAGAACAWALLQKGERVRMVDAGLRLEPEREERVARLRDRPAEEWTEAELAVLKEGLDATDEGVALKRLFGSDFVYRATEKELGIASNTADLKPSLALGGLSNVWGASMMPYRQSDIADWPVREEDLAPHYRAILEITGLAARHDALAELLPLHADAVQPLAIGSQAQALLSRLEKAAPALRRAGLHFGGARLAVKPPTVTADGRRDGCIYCRLCMYGCPFDFIYNSASTVQRLLDHPDFEYVPDVLVARVNELAGGIEAQGRYLSSGSPWSARADRVFLGAGVLPTARILMASESAGERSRTILDSQYFLFPLLTQTRSPQATTEKGYTLSQLFMEIDSPAVSPHLVHLQIYGYNELVRDAVRKKLGSFCPEAVIQQIVQRMMIAQGYLHSDHSHRISVKLRPQPSGESRLEIATINNPETASRVRGVLKHLLAQTMSLGAAPAFPMLKIAKPGRGFHSGGSVPMSAAPGEGQSDVLGRPRGWQRLFIVDSSVFPSIPATTITYSVMANARRIAHGALSA